MQLKYLSIAELIAGAGGDPWEINRTLQAGQPGQISGLANAFHAAGLASPRLTPRSALQHGTELDKAMLDWGARELGRKRSSAGH